MTDTDKMDEMLASINKNNIHVDNVPANFTPQVIARSYDIDYDRVHVAGHYDPTGECLEQSTLITISEFKDTPVKEMQEEIIVTDMPDPPTDLYIPIKGPSLFQRIKNWFS